jgi:benzoylformate decarboxylase
LSVNITDLNRTPTVREATLSLLRQLGIDTVFGNPGSTELPMFRDYPSDFRYVLGLQESIVVGMADGYAQATRNAALVNLHSAAGVGHAMGNIFTAFRNQTPLIITAGQQARSMLPFDPFLAAVQSTELPKPYVKWAIEPARGADIPYALARAYHIAMQPPRGPVFISIPADDWDQPSLFVPTRRVSHALAPDPAAIERVAKALNASRRPAVVVGAGVDRDGAVADTVALAERHRASVYVAPMSARCSFPERHPFFAGFLPALRDRIVQHLAEHDFILVLGAPAFIYHVEGGGPYIPEGAGLAQIVDDPHMAAWSPVGDAVVASIDLGVRALLAASEPAARMPPKPKAAPPLANAASPMSAAYVLQVLDGERQDGDIVVEEAPSMRPDIQKYLPMPGADSFYTMASGGLGHSMPAAVGIALARQQLGQSGRIIAVIGDGSSLYSIQALYTAALLQLPITFIIMNNARYAALQDFAPVFGYEQGVKPTGTDLAGIDFVKLSEAQGVPAERIETAHELPMRLRAALTANGPKLIDILVA